MRQTWLMIVNRGPFRGTRPTEFCSPDGAQRNPGVALRAWWSDVAGLAPDCASLHPGYDGELRAERLLQVRDQIFLVLDADREPDHVGAGAGLHFRGVVELAVRGRGRVNHQRAGVADIGQVREQLQL